MVKFRVDLTGKEYDALMEKFGNHGRTTEGASAAIKRMIHCINEFEELAKLAIHPLRSREIYRDGDIVITASGKNGKIKSFNLHR